MADLNLKQIEDFLNAEFADEARKLIFWYDDRGDFAGDVDALHLTNAKVYHLKPDNQFYTKYFLERVDTAANYLIYAPFPEPEAEDNHLEDTLLYSKRFYADRAALLCADLKIQEEYKWLIEKHRKLFRSKRFIQRFRDLEIDRFDEESILTGLLCAVCQTRTCSFDEAVCALLMEDSLKHNALFEKFSSCGLEEAFWAFCEGQFGYSDAAPSLERFVVTLFVTYTDRYMREALPDAWKPFVSSRPGSVIAFMDDLMNSVLYRDRFDRPCGPQATGGGGACGLSAGSAGELRYISGDRSGPDPVAYGAPSGGGRRRQTGGFLDPGNLQETDQASFRKADDDSLSDAGKRLSAAFGRQL